MIKYGEELADEVSAPPPPDKAEYHHIDLRGLQVSQVKSFGGENLCRQILGKLRL